MSPLPPSSVNKFVIRCLVVDDEPIAIKGIAAYIDQVDFLELAASCNSASQAAIILGQTQIDLLFLDVNMPYLSGMDFLETLQSPPLTIITTAYSEYALDGYRLNVVDYLMKPIAFKRFFMAASKAKDLFLLRRQEKNAETESKEIIFVKEGDRFIHIHPADILYIEGMQNYIKLHFIDKNIVIHETMNGIEQVLPQPTFFRIHRSYIANLPKAQSISVDHLVVNKKVLPIAKNRRKELMENVIYKNLLNR